VRIITVATARRDSDFPCSFTLDEIAEINQNTSIALATIREWMNSSVPINRLPVDVLSLIPTYLSSQNDRFSATFVCRHWRRTFLQYATLWSHLCLSKGEVYVKTLLERAKGSPLSILVGCMVPVGVIRLLPPYTKQIADLEFTNNHWVDIQRFSDLDSDSFPLLRTLNINVVRRITADNHEVMTPPSYPLFSGAVDLKEFRLHSDVSSFLSRFIFPNLTSFELSVAPVEGFYGSQLLDFLEATPMMQVVDVKILTNLLLEGVPRERVIVLQHVESLCLTASDGGPGYKLATHISCPSVKDTSITYMGQGGPHENPPFETFPASDSLNAIIRQCTGSPIEEVRLEIMTDSDDFVVCSLTFRSADTTAITFRFQVDEGDETPETFSCDVFYKACGAILDLPLLASIKHLHIYGLLNIDMGSTARIAHKFGGLLRSLGPLEELTIYRCDMRPYFLYYPEIVGYPPVRVLTLFDPWNTLVEDVGRGLVELAKAQYELGVPFERVVIRSYDPLADVDVENRLRLWVGAVTCTSVFE